MANKKAKQFMPFDALGGYQESLRDAEKIKIIKPVLSEDDYERLNVAFTQVKKGMFLSFRYYELEQIIEVSGIVSRIDFVNRYLKIDGRMFLLDDIIEII